MIGYCDDCPDPEACGQGAPCEVVRWVQDAINERKKSDDQG